MSPLSDPESSAPTEPPADDDAPTNSTRPSRRSHWLFALLIPLCAVAPWLVPWPWQQAQEPSSNPSSVIELAKAQQEHDPSDSKTPSAPTSEQVEKLGQALAASAGRYDKPVTAKQLADVSTTPGKYQKLGRIKIPAIGLDVSFGEGVYEETLLKGPGHWPGTPTPGGVGTSVLSGHRNTHTQPFKELDELEPGDKVIVTMTGADPVTFKVLDTTIVPEAKYPAFVLKPAKDPEARGLTLFACHPEGNPVFRIVVRAAMEK